MNGDALLQAVASVLGLLPWKLVYLGGSTTHLLFTDRAAPQPELTDDVDVVIEVTSSVAFHTRVREEMRALGAKEDTSEDAPLCRWIVDGIKVDLMTPNEEPLGFTNRWYPYALQTSRPHKLPNGSTIEVVSAVAFLATKLEAYKGRGRGDCLQSKDLEDVIAVLDGRPEISIEVAEAAGDVRSFIAQELDALLGDANFAYAVEGYFARRTGAKCDRVRTYSRHRSLMPASSPCRRGPPRAERPGAT